MVVSAIILEGDGYFSPFKFDIFEMRSLFCLKALDRLF